MISILLSTYNGEMYLKEQIDSIIKQTYTNWKLYIRDDGSSDSTVNIIKEYVNKYKNKIFIFCDSYGNLGSTKSFLCLLKNVDSDLFAFCDQDDIWKKEKLELLYKTYIQSQNINRLKPCLIHTSADVVDENLIYQKKITKLFNKNKVGMENSLYWQLFNNDVTGCTVLINKPMKVLFDTVDLNDIKVIQHDWLLAIIAFLYGNKIYLNAKTILYRQHGNNSVGANIKRNWLMIFKRILSKDRQFYPYYNQVKTIMSLPIELNGRYSNLLKQFSRLDSAPKIKRILWHIKNKFYGRKNIFYKIYQLLIC